MRKEFHWLFPTVSLGVVICLVTLTPPASMPNPPEFGDKVLHALAFAALVLPTSLLRPDQLRIVVVLSILYGGLIEWLQPKVGRTGDWGDLLADGIGVFAGVALGLVLRRVFVRAKAKITR